jgi:hypothetical protein
LLRKPGTGPGFPLAPNGRLPIEQEVSPRWS